MPRTRRVFRWAVLLASTVAADSAVATIVSVVQSAQIAPRNAFELAAGGTAYLGAYQVSAGFAGVQAGFGLTSFVELRATCSIRADGPWSGAASVGFGPKFRLSDSLAVLASVGFERDPPDAWWRSGRQWHVLPALVLTRPLGERKELNVTAQYLKRLDIDDDDMGWLGVGYGVRLKDGRLTLRPEVGVAFEEGEGTYFHASFGVSFRTR